MARKFLFIFAGFIVLALGSAFIYRIWGQQLLTAAMVPGVAFEPQPALGAGRYDDAAMWYAAPGAGPNDPTLWLPRGVKATAPAEAAIFFIHPTSYLDRRHWNAPLNDRESTDRAKLFLRGQASAFSAAGHVWAPRYRQATFGAFLTDKQAAAQALALAYGDIDAAFSRFLDANPTAPLILAGHSQGSLHLLRLLKERVAGTPLADRIVAVYAVGWPISLTTDLPALGIPACTKRGEAGCLIGWQSFAEPADPSLIVEIYDRETGFNGATRRGTAMLCTNPLTGAPNSAAAAGQNRGTLKPDKDMADADMIVGRVGARCDARGFLMIGDPPDLGPFVLPGNNYHVYDYSLFWANVRADALERLATFRAR